MKQLRLTILLVIFCTPISIFSQDLTGIWRGTFYNPQDIMLGGSKYRYEVQIDNHDREVKGVTYSYQTTRFYGKASLVGVWSSMSKNFVLKEDRMLDLKITGGGDGCLMTCYLTYHKEGNKEYMEGDYSSVNMNNKGQACGGGKVYIEKVTDTDFELEDFLIDRQKEANKGKVKPGQEDFVVKSTSPETPVTKTVPPKPKTTPPPTPKKEPPTVAKKPAPKATPPAENKTKAPMPVIREDSNATSTKTVTAEIPAKKTIIPPAPPPLKERKNELFKTITTSQKTIEISFFDNGVIDGDTISIYNNNKLIVSKKGLTTQPIIIKVEIDGNEPIQDIVMVAENMGKIPPNTALMIVKAGSERYTLNLSSTEQKNAMVRFQYKE